MANHINFQFESLDYQSQAVNSVVKLMDGLIKTTDSIYGNRVRMLRPGENEPIRNIGIVEGNRLINNLHHVQQENGLFTTDDLAGNNFSIEMETGTGKTYVYLKTILELNKQYGFNKFIIVVPSIAIRSGVMKSIQMLKEHFKTYGIDIEKHSFIYDSKNPAQVSTALVETRDLSICIMNTQAFNKGNINKIRVEDEYGQILWRDIQTIRPIVIIDEPQKLEGTGNKKSESIKAIEELNPLFVLRYSATHKKLYNPIYKLDSYDAFEKDLVKKIEVKTIHSMIPKSYPYIRYLKFTSDLKARIEIFCQEQGGRITFKAFNVRGNDSLYDLSGKMAQYENIRIAEDPHKLKSLKIATPQSVIELKQGEANIKQSENELIRIQIQLTIKEHLNKQFTILDRGEQIKVLSLFFIDEVSKVRDNSSEDGRGLYLRMFDEEYAKIIQTEPYCSKLQQYKNLFKGSQNVNQVREGYFAIDKNKVPVEVEGWDSSKEDNKLKAKSQEEVDRAIELILEKKDELISFEEPLAFIFSHSALREGWDNPNVFNICTLKQGASDIAKKQEIGRGLRLPVDTNGVRCKDAEINKLTVIANDNYEHFATMLQADYNDNMEFNREELTPEIIQKAFISAGIPKEKVTIELVNKLREELVTKKMINEKNVFTKESKQLYEIDFEDETLREHAIKIKEEIVNYMVQKGSKKVHIINGDNEPLEPNSPHKYVREPEFRKIINHLVSNLKKRSVYKAPIDKEKFIAECIMELNDYTRHMNLQMEFIQEVATTSYEEASRKFEMDKIDSEVIEMGYVLPTEARSELELVNYIMYHTMLPRLAIMKILQGIENRDVLNSQDVLEAVTEKITKKFKEAKAKAIVQESVGSYEVIQGYELKRTKILELDTIDEEMLQKERRVYRTDANKHRAMNKYYRTDSDGEYEFAGELEKNPNVLLFTKLKKGGFVINTPYGDYSPDWAVICKDETGQAKLYFIVETKWDKDWEDLSLEEKTKITCGKLHFAAVSDEIQFDWVRSYSEFRNKFNR